jgi:hypothetical protein
VQQQGCGQPGGMPLPLNPCLLLEGLLPQVGGVDCSCLCLLFVPMHNTEL